MRKRGPAAKVQQSDARLAILLEAVPDAMAVVNAGGEVQLVNEQWEELFGYALDELVGQPITTLLGERMRGGPGDRMPAPPGAHPERAEMIGRRKDGSWLPIDVRRLLFTTPGGAMLVTTARDMTERWQAGDLVLQAQEQDRKRIADEIHDDSIQTITAASLRLQQLRRSLHEPADLALLSALEELLEATSGSLRELMFELHPPSLDGLGIAAAIRELLDPIRTDRGIAFKVHSRIAAEPSTGRRITLFRIAEQALRDASAQGPNSITVEIDEHHRGWRLRVIHDGAGTVKDGVGMGPGRAQAAMRARLAGGWLRFERVPEGGARATLWIPAGPMTRASDHADDSAQREAA